MRPSRIARSAGADCTGCARRPRVRTRQPTQRPQKAGRCDQPWQRRITRGLRRPAPNSDALVSTRNRVPEPPEHEGDERRQAQCDDGPDRMSKAVVAVSPLPLHIGQLVEEVSGGDALQDDDDQNRERRQAVNPDRLPESADALGDLTSILDTANDRHDEEEDREELDRRERRDRPAEPHPRRRAHRASLRSRR